MPNYLTPLWHYKTSAFYSGMTGHQKNERSMLKWSSYSLRYSLRGYIRAVTSRLLHSLEYTLLRTVLFIKLLSCLRSNIVILDTLIVLLTYLLTYPWWTVHLLNAIHICQLYRHCTSSASLLRTKVYSAFHASGIGKWVPAAKAGMAHSDCGWTCGCAGKTVRSLENTCHIWALIRWCFTTKRCDQFCLVRLCVHV